MASSRVPELLTQALCEARHINEAGDIWDLLERVCPEHAENTVDALTQTDKNSQWLLLLLQEKRALELLNRSERPFSVRLSPALLRKALSKKQVVLETSYPKEAENLEGKNIPPLLQPPTWLHLALLHEADPARVTQLLALHPWDRESRKQAVRLLGLEKPHPHAFHLPKLLGTDVDPLEDTPGMEGGPLISPWMEKGALYQSDGGVIKAVCARLHEAATTPERRLKVLAWHLNSLRIDMVPSRARLRNGALMDMVRRCLTEGPAEMALEVCKAVYMEGSYYSSSAPQLAAKVRPGVLRNVVDLMLSEFSGPRLGGRDALKLLSDLEQGKPPFSKPFLPPMQVLPETLQHHSYYPTHPALNRLEAIKNCGIFDAGGQKIIGEYIQLGHKLAAVRGKASEHQAIAEEVTLWGAVDPAPAPAKARL